MPLQLILQVFELYAKVNITIRSLPLKRLSVTSYIKLPPVSNRKELLELLFEDQRIDTDEFEKLDTTQLLRIALLYHCTNLKLLNAWIRKKMYDRFHVFCQITDRLLSMP